MRICRNKIAVLLSAAGLIATLCACGIGNEGGIADTGTQPSQPTTVTVATGSLAVDSWGYTGATAAQLTAPAKTEVLVQGRTLLEDAAHAVVSGTVGTKVVYSADVTTLPSAAQASAPGTLVSYLQMLVGEARDAQPGLSASVDAGSLAAGESVTVYRYDSTTGRWTSPQSAVVGSTGKISFTASQLALYGVFR